MKSVLICALALCSAGAVRAESFDELYRAGKAAANAKKGQEAVELLDKALAAWTPDLGAHKKAEALLYRGEADTSLKRWADCIADLSAALEDGVSKKQEPYLYRHRAWCRYKTGDRDGALADLAESERLGPGDPVTAKIRAAIEKAESSKP